MLILPAIDLIDGKCVRLTKGDYSQMKEYPANPTKVAREFKKAGAKMLHVVDLEGAKAGRVSNLETIKKLLAVGLPLQVGGGIRNYESAKKLLDFGVARIILGTAALYDQNLIQKLIADFGAEKIVISIDIKYGKIAVKGWKETSDISIGNLIETLKKLSVQTIIATDISRDGMLAGVNLNSIKQFIGQGFNLIVAGGVTTTTDILDLKKLGADGAIIGKAIYEGKINLNQALSC